MEQTSYIQSEPSLDAIFSALSDGNRRAILKRLAQGEASVKELAEPFNISQPAISKHLKVLEQAGLIERVVDRQRRPARLKAAPMENAVKWLEDFERFWLFGLDDFDRVLADLEKQRKQ